MMRTTVWGAASVGWLTGCVLLAAGTEGCGRARDAASTEGGSTAVGGAAGAAGAEGAETIVRSFRDVSAEAGIEYEHAPQDVLCGACIPPQLMTGGAAAADYDGDGWTDLLVTRLEAPSILYKNQGDGSFRDVTLKVGLEVPFRSNGAVWGDIDNDGDLDLFVSVVELFPEEVGQAHFLLFINEAGRFHEQALERGVARQGPQWHRGFSATFGDYDRDGFLDLHVTEWVPLGAVGEGGSADFNVRLFRNLGPDKPGFFEDTTDKAGVAARVRSDSGVFVFTSAFSDLDEDGWPDLLLAGDFGTSRLFWNNGDGTFTDGTRAAGVGTDENGMGLALGDYDGDGHVDVFVTSIWCSPECPAAGPISGVGVSGNRLFQNHGDRSFTDRTDAAGVRIGYWGWGAQFFDYDNDADLDLVMTNGYTYPTDWYQEFYQDPMLFWENDGRGGMREKGRQVGVTDTASGKGLLVFDYDNDGDEDVYVVNNSGKHLLLRNDGEQVGSWLKFQLRGTVSNRDGIGARIRVQLSTGRVLVRELYAGGQFLGQNGHVLHMGLGLGVEQVERVEVLWPSGNEQHLSQVAANQWLEIVEERQ